MTGTHRLNLCRVDYDHIWLQRAAHAHVSLDFGDQERLQHANPLRRAH
jgi:hypothetical protein